MSRILLLLASKENRRLLAGWLATRYAVVPPEAVRAHGEPFDLCILDGPALGRLGAWVRQIKAVEQPVFLPVLLITHREDVGMATRHLWESIDELIVSPVEKAELHARVETLLRVRQLSLQNAALARQLEAELARAGAVQAELLPRDGPELPGFELAARCLPAHEVGGDFYDWQELAPGVIALTLGDVMGKGMPAALLMTTVRATLRGVARQNPPAAALELAWRALESDLERVGGFATLFHARLDVGLRRLRYVDAGHGYAFLLHGDGMVEELDQGGRPLGFPIGSGYREGVVTFRPGDALVVYSDGLLEIRPEMTRDHQALSEELRDAASAADMVARLMGPAAQTSPPPDDLTVVVLRSVEPIP